MHAYDRGLEAAARASGGGGGGLTAPSLHAPFGAEDLVAAFDAGLDWLELALGAKAKATATAGVADAGGTASAVIAASAAAAAVATAAIAADGEQPRKLLALACATLDAMVAAMHGSDAAAEAFVKVAMGGGTCKALFRHIRILKDALEQDLSEPNVAAYEAASRRVDSCFLRSGKGGVLATIPGFRTDGDGNFKRASFLLESSDAALGFILDNFVLGVQHKSAFGTIADTRREPRFDGGGDIDDASIISREKLGARVFIAASVVIFAFNGFAMNHLMLGRVAPANYFKVQQYNATATLTQREWAGLFAGFTIGMFSIMQLNNLSAATGLICSPAMKLFIDPSVDGVSRVLDALASTSLPVDHIEISLACISSWCGFADGWGVRFATELVRKGAFTLLQPVLLHASPSLAIRAAFCVGAIATTVPMDAAEPLQRSGVLSVIADVLHALTPGDTQLIGQFLVVVPIALKMIAPDENPALQLAGLQRLSASLGPAFKAMNAPVANTPTVVAALRLAASSADAFIYSAAAFVLREIEQPVPIYRQTRAGGGAGPDGSAAALSAANAPSWTTEQVGLWLSRREFKAFRAAFKDGFVNGRMLLRLSDAHLEDLGVTRPVHRLAVLDAIDDLRTAVAANGMRGAMSADAPVGAEVTTARGDSAIAGVVIAAPPSGAGAQPVGALPASGEAFDVFISYRRAGGADFAQLIKIQLQAHGLSVFLDTDNLGAGRFQDELVSHLRSARNVVLVWSLGCMDRFLDDKDAVRQDFVRLEYMQSLRLQKHVVPVYKEDFIFPDAERLPEDCRAVLGMNAIRWVADYREASFKKLASALR